MNNMLLDAHKWNGVMDRVQHVQNWWGWFLWDGESAYYENFFKYNRLKTIK